MSQIMNIKMPNTIKLCGVNYAIVTNPEQKQQIADKLGMLRKDAMSIEWAHDISVSECFYGYKAADNITDYGMISDHDLREIMAGNGYRMFDNALDYEIAMNPIGSNYTVLYNRHNPRKSPMFITSIRSITLDNHYDLSIEYGSGKFLAVRRMAKPDEFRVCVIDKAPIYLTKERHYTVQHLIYKMSPWTMKTPEHGQVIQVGRKKVYIGDLKQIGGNVEHQVFMRNFADNGGRMTLSITGGSENATISMGGDI